MKKVILFSILLILGLICSQFVVFLGNENRLWFGLIVKNLTLIFLAFIMIHVGLEFSIDKSNLQQYGWDYFVAFTAATLPWIFCTLYFVYFFQHELAVSQFDIWIDALLLARFAAPTSAGVLFAMMIAAGLEGTWVFKKARILAIFDDLDTIILLIPIKMMIVGFKWEIFGLLAVIFILIFLSWKKMHVLKWPIHWYWILIYSIVLVTICEGMYLVTTYLKDIYPLQLEVLLPAFVLGCMLALPAKKKGGCDFFEKDSEKKVKFLIGALFIFLVGLSMPALEISRSVTSGSSIRQILLEYKIGSLNLITVGWHVLVITFLSNLGKMFPLFCYRKEAKWKERLALSLGMCPRGEVGAGVIVLALALSLNLNHALIVIAVLSLGLNLILTGPIIILIKKLLTKPVSKIRADSGNS